ncbi:MAG: polyprenyl glycosylphosphotransferase [Desulfobacterales bacterium]|nr:MAG: polyprenyl glycosylphosphotransferase [Desulfobacterales bacterium]
MYESNDNEIGNNIFLLDLLSTIVIFLATFWIRNTFLLKEEPLDFYSHLFIIPLLLALISGSLSYFGAYNSPHTTTITSYAWAITRSVVLTVGILLTLLFFLNIQYVSRFVILGFACAEFFTLLIIRSFIISYYKNQIKSGKRALRVIIVGTRARALDLFQNLHEQIIWGVTVVGFIDPDPAYMGTMVNDIPVIGTVENIHECLKNNVVDEVIVAIPRSLLNDAEPIVIACEEEGIRLRFMADLFNIDAARVSLAMLGSLPILTMEPVARNRQQLLVKRAFDFSVTLFSLTFLVPLFILIALMIKLDSPGPVFFIQQRVGLRKHIFPMFKFRSMCADAEEKITQIEHLNEADGPIFKIKNDPRVTRVGSFLRKTSLDELPQLINVLRGEMSLVGPRPMSQRDVDLFDRGIQRKRFSVQPGLTCLWQISGRSNLPFEKWLDLDLEYIENWSFWLDIKILLKTIPAVIRSRGAM